VRSQVSEDSRLTVYPAIKRRACGFSQRVPALLASAKRPHLQRQGCSQHAGERRWGFRCSGGQRLTIHSSRTCFVTSKAWPKSLPRFCLHYASRLNSGVRRHGQRSDVFARDTNLGAALRRFHHVRGSFRGLEVIHTWSLRIYREERHCHWNLGSL